LKIFAKKLILTFISLKMHQFKLKNLWIHISWAYKKSDKCTVCGKRIGKARLSRNIWNPYTRE